jgi:hypothetical protein
VAATKARDQGIDLSNEIRASGEDLPSDVRMPLVGATLFAAQGYALFEGSGSGIPELAALDNLERGVTDLDRTLATARTAAIQRGITTC